MNLGANSFTSYGGASLICLIVVCLFSPPAGAEEAGSKENTKIEHRENVVVVGLTGLRHALTTGDSNDLLGNSAEISLGVGKIDKLWYARLTADLYLGPYDPVAERQLNAEFEGTGLTMFAGYSAESQDIRSTGGGYGFACGLIYSDIKGHSVGSNRFLNNSNSGDPDRRFMSAYNVRFTSLSLAPAIFFSNFKEARRQGNSPEDLITRFEGFDVLVGVAIPIYARYKARYSLVDASENLLEPRAESGKMKGHSIFVNVTAYLGI